MKDILNGNFFNPTRGSLPLAGVVEELKNYIQEKPGKFYDVIVGCDSSSGETPTFPLAIVILRIGEGGRFFLKKINYQGRVFHNRYRERILQEVLLSCQLASFLKENLEKSFEGENFKYQFRYIHADVGENGATKDMIKEVTGLIIGNGFEPVIKPESFAASNVADRYS